jgi:undecaprenyl-diphosphatase
MMNLWQALFLGVLQGVTEFLPISSSGHLALAQNWLNLQEPLLAFDVFLHAVSLIAIIIFFFKELKKITFKQLFVIGVGTIPAVIVGLLFKDSLESLFHAPTLVGVALLFTGINNIVSHKLLQKKTEEKEITIKKSLIIGFFQSLALIPGISRSGTTLLGSLGQKLEKNQAFNFTFMLAIPAILGALTLQLVELTGGNTSIPHWSLFMIGGIGALIASLASLGIIKKLIEKSKFMPFGIYAIALGSFVIISSIF